MAEEIDHEARIDKCKGIFMSYATFWKFVVCGFFAMLVQLGALYAWSDTKYTSVNDGQDAKIIGLEIKVAEISAMRSDLSSMLSNQRQVNHQLTELMVRLRK